MFVRIKECERALIQLKTYSPRLAWPQEHFLKSFQLFDGSIYWRIYRGDIELGNLCSGTPAGIRDRKAYFCEVVVVVIVLNVAHRKTNFCERLSLAFVVFPLERSDVEIRVSERSIRESKSKWELRLNLVLLISAISHIYSFGVGNRRSVADERIVAGGRISCNCFSIVTGSLPEGLTSPKRISPSASPPFSPGY